MSRVFTDVTPGSAECKDGIKVTIGEYLEYACIDNEDLEMLAALQ